MAYEGWFSFNGTEIVNAGRTVALARALNIDAVRLRQTSVGWVEATFDAAGFGVGLFGLGPFGGAGGAGGPDVDYADITTAPWYDARTPASAEFAGLLPLDVRGLEDSSLTAETTEFITNGGHSGLARNAALTIVTDAVLVASTERGAEYGRRWLNRALRGSDTKNFCAGSDLVYFRYPEVGAPLATRRDVRVTRGTSVTRKRSRACSTIWRLTFTMTAGDPFEYGPAESVMANLGAAVPDILGTDYGVISGLVETDCPQYDYTPVYDPAYPALIPSPTAPHFLPDGWSIEPGMKFRRHWARLPSLDPAHLDEVPIFTLNSPAEARRVRLSIWPAGSAPDENCGALFSVVVNYLPPGVAFYVDGEQGACYVWDGSSPYVRRSDSLVFSRDAGPVEWASVSDPDEFLVTLDLFEVSPGVYEGGGDLRVDLALVSKSD